VGGRWLLLAGAAAAAAVVGTVLALVLAPGSTGPTHSTDPTYAAGRAQSSHPAASATAAAATTPARSTSPIPSVGTSAATSPSGRASSVITPPATPTTSLIAVTVCSDPGTGCQTPGSTQYMEVRPTQLTDSGDGSGYVQDLVWTDWGAAQAHASGTQEINNCVPSCASGTYTGSPATVTVTGLTSYGTGLEAYSTILIQWKGGSSTYTKSTTIPG
jgi:hypothetical protein